MSDLSARRDRGYYGIAYFKMSSYNLPMKKLILILILLPVIAQAKNLHSERWYQDRWCAERGGLVEYRLLDGTRVDCLTSENATELDFSRKWYQAIGQSLYYSMQTGKRAGIALIVERPKDRKYWIRMNSTIRHFGLPIDTWVIKP